MRTHKVGELKPNAFGLHDIHGNVREWNEDMLTRATSGEPMRFARGGNWRTPAGSGPVAYRTQNLPAARHASYGFRLARFPLSEVNP